jgi:hypothetical protein
MKLLLKGCKSLDVNNIEVFEAFIRSLCKDRAILEQFLKLGIDVNECRCETSALSHAAQWGESDLVSFLLQRGAKVDLPANLGRTALAMACGQASSTGFSDEPSVQTEYLKTIRLLLEAGADPNKADQGGFTPIDTVVIAHWPELLELLLDYGARLELSKDEGRFAVERSIAQGDVATVKLLVDFGLQPSMKLANGMTAIDFAKKCKMGDKVCIMQNAGTCRSPKSLKNSSSRLPQKTSVKSGFKIDTALIGSYEIDSEKTAKLMVASGQEMVAGKRMVMKKGYDQAVKKLIRDRRQILRGISLEIGNGTFTYRGEEGKECFPARSKKNGKQRILVVEWGNIRQEFLVREVAKDTFQFKCDTSDLSQFIWKKL